MRASTLSRWLAGFVVVLAGAASAGETPTFADYVGVYEGQWVNATYGSFAPARIRIEVNGNLGTLAVDLDNGPNGSVFGLPMDPPEVTFTGTVGSHVLSKQADSVFGDVSCSGSPASFQCTASAISAYVVSGSISGGITGDDLNTTYQLELFDLTMAQGQVTATKLPEPGSTAAAAASVACLALARRRARR
jgi:hypothetical protein